jgi:hypothetical protein
MKNLDKQIAEMQGLAASTQSRAARQFSGSVSDFDKAVKELRSMDLAANIAKLVPPK